MLRWMGWRRRWARQLTDDLDRLAQLTTAVTPRVPEAERPVAADAVAVLVKLADAHRYYAKGWISGRELRRRTNQLAAEFAAIRESAGLPPAGCEPGHPIYRLTEKQVLDLTDQWHAGGGCGVTLREHCGMTVNEWRAYVERNELPRR